MILNYVEFVLSIFYSSSNKQSLQSYMGNLRTLLHRINYQSATSSQRDFYQLSPTTVISGEAFYELY